MKRNHPLWALTSAYMRHLRTVRERHGLSVREVAEKVGISPGWLRRLETGKHDAAAVTMFCIIEAMGEPIAGFYKEAEALHPKLVQRVRAAMEKRRQRLDG